MLHHKILILTFSGASIAFDYAQCACSPLHRDNVYWDSDVYTRLFVLNGASAYTYLHARTVLFRPSLLVTRHRHL